MVLLCQAKEKTSAIWTRLSLPRSRTDAPFSMCSVITASAQHGVWQQEIHYTRVRDEMMQRGEGGAERGGEEERRRPPALSAYVTAEA